jgi:hypothetical protein
MPTKHDINYLLGNYFKYSSDKNPELHSSKESNKHTRVLYTADGCRCDIFFISYRTMSGVMTNSLALVLKKRLILFIKFEITIEKFGSPQME